MTKRIKNKFYPAAMTVAGSDSGGGAGIAADLRTFNAFGVFGTCAITAVTAQNPSAVRRIDPMAAESVKCQIETVLEKIPVNYVKTGMLFSKDILLTVVEAVKKYQLKLVCDPVMISTSGKKLLNDDAVKAMDELFALARWITPNIPEAELISGRKITSLRDMIDTAKSIADRFQCNILLKGGHLPENPATDIVVKDGTVFTLSAPELELPPLASHGTGCTLSAALTAMLALDFSWKQAVCSSKAFVYGSLCQTVEIGAGVSAMYPPVEDYSQMIKIAETE